MAIKTVTICDGCGKMLEKSQDIYQLSFKTDSFWSGADTGYLQENLHFCYACAHNIKENMEKIASNLKGGNHVQNII